VSLFIVVWYNALLSLQISSLTMSTWSAILHVLGRWFICSKWLILNSSFYVILNYHIFSMCFYRYSVFELLHFWIWIKWSVTSFFITPPTHSKCKECSYIGETVSKYQNFNFLNMKCINFFLNICINSEKHFYCFIFLY